jgi:IS30 family transposase
MNKFKHLSEKERIQIQTLHEKGCSSREIGKMIQRDHSTIVRELQRNSQEKIYDAEIANRSAKERQQEAHSRPKKSTHQMKKIVEKYLVKHRWSPVQIAGRLAKKCEELIEELGEAITFSFRTIYNFIKKDREQGGNLYKSLRHKGKKYRKNGCKESGAGLIKNRKGIHERPSVVEEKSRVGDWEGDLIVGAEHSGYIISFVERKTKYTILIPVPCKESSVVGEATIERLKPITHLLHTITFDNGKEFACHETLEKELGIQVYFARPYRSCDRGLNEHTNGLVREYLPKGTSFANLEPTVLKQIETDLNTRPRKILDFQKPEEVILDLNVS